MIGLSREREGVESGVRKRPATGFPGLLRYADVRADANPESSRPRFSGLPGTKSGGGGGWFPLRRLFGMILPVQVYSVDKV